MSLKKINYLIATAALLILLVETILGNKPWELQNQLHITNKVSNVKKNIRCDKQSLRLYVRLNKQFKLIVYKS